MRRFSHLLAAIATLTLVSACTKPDTKPDGVNGNEGTDSSASFRVKTVKGEGALLDVKGKAGDGTINLASASIWKIPRQASYTFLACIEDRASGRDARGHRFEVEIPGSRKRISGLKATTPEGCFHWEEPFDFSYFVGRSSWITVERDIIGTGVHTGRQRVQLAINPWAIGSKARDGGDSFRYLRTNPPPQSQLKPFEQADASLSGTALGEDELFIDEVDAKALLVGKQDGGMRVKLKLAMKPKVYFENIEGRPDYRDLSDGEFEVIAHLMVNQAGEDMDKRVILTRPPKLDPGVDPIGAGIVGVGLVKNGRLLVEINTTITDKVTQGNLELAMIVRPRGIRGIKESRGVYDLGTYGNLSSIKGGDLKKECREGRGCDVPSYLKGAVDFAALGRYASTNPLYLFDRLNLRFGQVDEGETTTWRRVSYSASTCVTNGFTGDRPIGLPMTVTYSNGETKQLMTGEDGCLRWNHKIDHKYYAPEKFLEQNIVITEGKGFSRNMKFYINPWDDKFTFGFDEREFDQDFWKKLAARKKIPSRFFLADFGYHTVRFQYNIDSLMALEVRKTVLMELDPRVLRYSGIINARKMTEPLRDGIWLMKVAIQKNYLDPAQQGVSISSLTERDQAKNADKIIPPALSEKKVSVPLLEQNLGNRVDTRKRLRDLNIDLPQREFVSTQTALVRTTDGVIIQPVEFTMQDLRMMRVRSNFLIELQPVNERQLIAQNVIQDNFKGYLQNVRTAYNEKLGKRPDEDIEKMRDAGQAEVKARVEERQKETRRIFKRLQERIEQATTSGTTFDPFTIKSEDLLALRAGLPIRNGTDPANEKERDRGAFAENLAHDLRSGDFTKITLPSCQQVDCEAFVEKGKDADDVGEDGPGLARRTFVGPVIFLSNGYKDSVRATDNLDEAQCNRRVEYGKGQEFDEVLDRYQWELFEEADARVKGSGRDNLAYRFSEFFGSLRHLCYSHVDDLIQREDKIRATYQENIPAVGSVYNYAEAYGMNFLSLADEKPKAVSFTPENFERCGGNLTKCMQPTNQYWLPVSGALNYVNRYFDRANGIVASVYNLFAGQVNTKTEPWTVGDLRQALFGTVAANTKRYAACSLVTGTFVDSLRSNGRNSEVVNVGVLENRSLKDTEVRIMDACLRHAANPIFFDNKLRIFKTGQTGDSYLFLGGYQMNINVGQSFSLGRSTGYSLSAGVELTDFVGAAGGVSNSLGRLAAGAYPAAGAGAMLGAGMSKVADKISPMTSLIKPLSIKAGWSTGNSLGDGTSISESTYLVAQIAKFSLRLDEYERCVALSFNEDFVAALGNLGIIQYRPDRYGPYRKVFACEGEHITEPRMIEEMYFYFTQHFTEGDMLDQADLYNHPWLLGLRGNRDFATFVSRIRKQGNLSFWDLAKDPFNLSQRSTDWPLDHMRKTYRQIVPTFPGFYTVLDEAEKLTEFPLEINREAPDKDINGEVFRGKAESLMRDRRTSNR